MQFLFPEKANEMLLFDCPRFAKRLPEKTGRDIDRNAYRVELVGNRLEWVTREGNNQVRFDSEPENQSLEAHPGHCPELAAD